MRHALKVSVICPEEDCSQEIQLEVTPDGYEPLDGCVHMERLVDRDDFREDIERAVQEAAEDLYDREMDRRVDQERDM